MKQKDNRLRQDPWIENCLIEPMRRTRERSKSYYEERPVGSYTFLAHCHPTSLSPSRRTPQDVRVRLGADVASDHHLLIAQLKLKLRRNWTEPTNQRLRYNTTLLKDTNKREEFNIALSNRFQVLQQLLEEETIDVGS